MKFKSILASVFLVTSIIHAAWSADTDLLWTKVIANNQEAKKWAAKDVDQLIHASKDSDPTKIISI
jgi:hypothetical protein